MKVCYLLVTSDYYLLDLMIFIGFILCQTWAQSTKERNYIRDPRFPCTSQKKDISLDILHAHYILTSPYVNM